ncbi:MAG TPA: dTDP-4-dehydrorhamnose reductase [Cyclobacteriaceae bacterium]|nr:dTDP-4-dehydrorhamnose reductase [Cyclobacteriaceae bacterium]
MKNILVTGGNGQLGSELRELSGKYPAFNFTFIDIAELDLLDEAAVRKFVSSQHFDFIINCAAYTAVDKAEEDKDLCKKVNADSVLLLAVLARENNSRLIHISTDYVFDGEFNQPIDETAVPNPGSVYGRTKLEGEQHVLRELKNAYVIRTAWVYSTFGKNFVKTIGGLAKQRPELTVVADQFGSPTYARDLAIAIMAIVVSVAEGKKDEPGIYHFTNEGAITWYDFAVFIKDHYGFACKVKPIKTHEYKTAAARPKFSVLDKTKIKKTFGIEIPHWSQSLRECLNKLEL